MGAKRSVLEKSADKSRTLVARGKELIESSRQALKYSRLVLAEAEERAAKKESTHAPSFIFPKERQ
jgi:hypothetical protein